jgi:hypothetical protein
VVWTTVDAEAVKLPVERPRIRPATVFLVSVLALVALFFSAAGIGLLMSRQRARPQNRSTRFLRREPQPRAGT